jgi:branched-chain amino acid transport system substrate-binding protein
MTFSKRALCRFGGMLCVAAIAVAACGSTSKSASSPTTTATGGAPPTVGATSAAPSGAPIKIGYICLCNTAETQSVALVNDVPAFTAWEKWTNANGGINGHPVQVIFKSDPGNQGVALLAVKQLVGEGVVGIVDEDTEDGEAWASYIQSAGVPVFDPSGFSGTTLSESPNVFSTAVSQFYVADEIILAAKKAGANNLAVLYCAEDPVCKQTVTGLKAAGKTLGMSIAFEAPVLASAPNYTAQCLAAKEHGADALFIQQSAGPTKSIAAGCAQQGYTPHQVSDDGAYNQSFAGSPGMNGMLGAEGDFPFFLTSTPASRTMHQAFDQYSPSITKSPDYDGEAVQNWAAGLLITEAAEAGKVGMTNPLTAAALMSGVYTLHSTNLDGLTPTLTFVQGQPHENHCWFWLGIENNKWTTPYGLTPACAPVLPSS